MFRHLQWHASAGGLLNLAQISFPFNGKFTLGRAFFLENPWLCVFNGGACLMVPCARQAPGGPDGRDSSGFDWGSWCA